MPIALVAALLTALASPTGVAAGIPAADLGSASTPASLYPVPATDPVHPHGCSASQLRAHGSGRPEQPRRDPAGYGQNLPDPVEVAAHHADLTFLNGKGIWWTVWPGSHVDVAGAVRRAKAAGLRQIWVRTGGSISGWYGGPMLERLLPAAHDVGLAVVAWD